MERNLTDKRGDAKALYKTGGGAIIDSTMAQLIVRGIEEKVVRKLKQRAGERGISMEEEHRRILRETLLGDAQKKGRTFVEHLLSMPNVGSDDVFARQKDHGRDVEL